MVKFLREGSAMSKVFNVYIDEAGDEGFKSIDGRWVSSKWFIIGALVVPEEFDREMASVVNQIKDHLNVNNKLKPMHFAGLRHRKRRYVIQQIANKGHFRLIIVGLHKPELIKDGPLKREKQYLYNYVTRYLLERVSWLANDYSRKVNLIFENRGNTSYNELDLYVKDLLEDPNCQIRQGTFLSWKALNKGQSKNLQVADSLVSSVFAALEPDIYGNVEASYIKDLNDFFYRRKGNLFSYGLKLFPHPGNSENAQSKCPWLKDIK